MDTTNPNQNETQTAPSNFDNLAMVTAASALANNPGLSMAAALLATPNPHFLNALNNAFPLYSVAGTTNILNALVSNQPLPVQQSQQQHHSMGHQQQGNQAGTSFIQQQQANYNNLLASQAVAHCSCNISYPPSLPHSITIPNQQQDERPTPSGFARSLRKRPHSDSVRSGSGSSRQPSAKFQRVSSSSSSSSNNQRRPDTPIISPSDSPQRFQAPLTDNFIESVVHAVAQQQNSAMSQRSNPFLRQPQQQQTQNQTPHCPVCNRHQQPSNSNVLTQNPPNMLTPAVTIQSQSVALATSSQTNLFPQFVLPPSYSSNNQTPNQLQLNQNVQDDPTVPCLCTGFHCARCMATDQQQRTADFGAWLGREQQQASAITAQQLSQAAANAAAAVSTQDMLAMALNRFHHHIQHQQPQAPQPQPPRIRQPTQILQQHLALFQASNSATPLNRQLPHQMARASSLNVNSYSNNNQSTNPTQNTHPDHLALLQQRQQSQRQSNDYINRFYAANSVVLPSQAPQQASANPQNPMDHIALRGARLNPAAASIPYQHQTSLLLLSNMHHLATDMPMIFFPATTNGDYILSNQEAVTHAVATAMHHAPEPQPVGASSDQIKRCTQIRNYIKDADVPEQERERCTVCLMDFETGDDIRTLNCSHLFHIDCIDRWLAYNKKCPVCRVDMDKLTMLITDQEDETLGLAAAAQ